MSRWRGAIRPMLSASCLRWSTSRSSGSTSKIAIPLSMAAFSPMWSAAGSGSRPARPRPWRSASRRRHASAPVAVALGKSCRMKQNHYPSHIQSKLDELAQAVEYLAEQARQNQRRHRGRPSKVERRLSKRSRIYRLARDARSAGRRPAYSRAQAARRAIRVGGLQGVARGFARATPCSNRSRPPSLTTISASMTYVSASPTARTRSHDCVRCRRREPTSKRGSKAYVAALARPRVSGVAAGQQLRVDWPTKDPIALLAFLLPEQMVDALMKEIERHANTPMPLAERKKRIAELEAEVEALQRRALALGADLCLMPAPVVLGVRATRQTKRAA